MATSVIIPARNEETTIAKIVSVFQEHPVTTGRVFVGIDAATVDSTPYQARKAGAHLVRTLTRGKGQTVYGTLLEMSMIRSMLTERIILCDADYEGLTTDHVTRIVSKPRGMTIGVPDWPDIPVPERVTNAWPQVSGFRCLPWAMIPADAHGYLLETQLNIRAIKLRQPIHHVFMNGLKSPFQWPLPERRFNELRRDQEWGTKNGWL